MAHLVPPRTAIRDAIAARLAGVDGDGESWTAAGPRVFADRLAPLGHEDLPAILVYTRREPVDRDSYPDAGQDGWTRRDLELAIEAVAAATRDLDDALDGLCAGIERALEWFEIPGFESATIRLTDTDYAVVGIEDGQQPIGVAAMSWTVRYHQPWRVLSFEHPEAEALAAMAPEVGPGHEAAYVPLADPVRMPGDGGV